MWTVRVIFLWVFAAAAAYMDLRYRRVPNRLILCTAAGGMVLSAAGGRSALLAGFTGMALGFLLLFPAFLLHMVGGGDVKSLAVIGLVAGPGLLWSSFIRGAAAAGLVALVILGVRRWRSGRNRDAAAWTLPYAGILSISAALSALLA